MEISLSFILEIWARMVQKVITSITVIEAK